METIRAIVHGVYGKMGQEAVRAICREADMALVGVASRSAQPGSYPLPDGSGSVPLSNRLEEVIAGADVVVDFTSAEGAMTAMRTASASKVNVVTGSTGLTEADLQEAEELYRQHEVCIVVAPNFALGAALMAHLARIAAPYFDYADLAEMHHEAKKDAPSGTALAVARAVVEGRGRSFLSPRAEKETLPGTRGGVLQGVNIHSARMPGRVAHHELVFGTLGQTLTIRHDSVSRESFMPGVMLAIREAVKAPRFVLGLENVLGL